MSCPERFGRPRSGYSGNKALQMRFFSVECRDRPWITQFLPETANPAWGDSVPEDIECDLEATKAPTWHIHAAKEKKGATNLASSDNINPCLEAGDLKLRSFQASSLQNNSTRFKTVPNQAGRCEEDAESKECHCKTLLLSLLETYAPDKIFIFQRCLMQNCKRMWWTINEPFPHEYHGQKPQAKRRLPKCWSWNSCYCKNRISLL